VLGIKEKIFGTSGYSTDLQLTPAELSDFRRLINEQWLTSVSRVAPELRESAAEVGIENYHLISDKLDHKSLWPKANRVLPQESVERIKAFPFFDTLRQEFGEFSVSDVYDVKQHHGHEEIYWRLVRPNVHSDVGAFHADHWFHKSFNNGYGMFAEGVVTVKIWIPIHCEPGKSGLSIVVGSHTKEWRYHYDVIDGFEKPVIDEDVGSLNALLVHTEPGNMLLFNEKLLHAGVVNRGRNTRVSAEITMVMKSSMLQDHGFRSLL
jgi:hypothetical protein